MDNFRFDITAKGDLLPWLACCMGSRKAVGWSVREYDKGLRLVLYWVAPTPKVHGYHPLPSPVPYAEVATFATSWLNSVAFGTEPDHDGDNSRGWRIYNEDWGHVDGLYQAFLAIAPAWAMHGK